MKTGIIFDLDGTLWNAAENISKSWNIVLQKRNYLNLYITPEMLMAQMGKVMTDIADSLFPQIDVPKRYELLKECCEFEKQHLAVYGGVLYDGVEEVLKELSSSYDLFIVSNCQQGYIETFLRFYDFEKYITDIEDAGHTGLPKADNIKLVVERNQLKRAFYVGDTLTDMKSSDEAGVEFIHAAYGFGTLTENRPSIAAFRELPVLVQKLLEKETI